MPRGQVGRHHLSGPLVSPECWKFLTPTRIYEGEAEDGERCNRPAEGCQAPGQSSGLGSWTAGPGASTKWHQQAGPMVPSLLTTQRAHAWPPLPQCSGRTGEVAGTVPPPAGPTSPRDQHSDHPALPPDPTACGLGLIFLPSCTAIQNQVMQPAPRSASRSEFSLSHELK